MLPSVLSPRGQTPGISEAFDFDYLSRSWELTKSLGPWVGMFDFFVRRNGTKSHHHVCSSVGHLEIILAEKKTYMGVLEVSTCFQQITTASHFVEIVCQPIFWFL